MRRPARSALLLAALPTALVALAGPVLAAPGGTPGPPDHGRSAADARPRPSLAGHRHARVCDRPQPGSASCASVVDLDVAGPLATGAGAPAGYGPADLQSAYGLGGSGGAGRTIAIVDAYDQPSAQADLDAYRAQYGLPACGAGCFSKVGQSGTSALPAANASWGQEIDLDLQMASAACPACRLLLVEASSTRMSDLGAAVNTAVRLGATVVSNSYGGAESSAETSSDTSYYRHPGVAITASAGDSGYGVSYPAASPYVTAVGGTSLTAAATARGWSESTWSGTGSGCSAYEPKPAWQSDTGCAKRLVADVSAVADPATGVAVYDSTPSNGVSGWLVFGGTSAAAPLVAGAYALAAPAPSTSNPAQFPYAAPAGLWDVTTGSNGSCGSYLCTAGAGADGPTGLGTPHGPASFGPATSGGTPAPPSTTTATQLLGNPGFETGTAAPWTASTGVVDSSTAQPARTGAWKAWLDGYGTTHTDTLTQAVALPSTATRLTAQLWLHVDTAETSAKAYDRLSVRLLDAGGALLTTLGSASNLDATPGYVARSYDLTAYKGRSVQLQLVGTEDASLRTSFVVDDATVTTS